MLVLYRALCFVLFLYRCAAGWNALQLRVPLSRSIMLCWDFCVSHIGAVARRLLRPRDCDVGGCEGTVIYRCGTCTCFPALYPARCDLQGTLVVALEIDASMNFLSYVRILFHPQYSSNTKMVTCYRHHIDELTGV